MELLLVGIISFTCFVAGYAVGAIGAIFRVK